MAYIVKEAKKDEIGEYDPEEVLFVVQGEMEYGNLSLIHISDFPKSLCSAIFFCKFTAFILCLYRSKSNFAEEMCIRDRVSSDRQMNIGSEILVMY